MTTIIISNSYLMTESGKSRDRYNELAAKWLDGSITPEEIREYNDWYNGADDQPAEVTPEFAPTREALEERLMEKILRSVRRREPVAGKWRYAVSAAALVLLMLGGGYLWYGLRSVREYPEAVVKNPAFRNDVLPGKDKAVLALSDGRRIVLDGRSEGVVAREGAVPIRLLSDGTVTYDRPDGEMGATEPVNTLSVPRGAQYKIRLTDGTKVWLNAESSITFPVSFKGEERRVSIRGEAYFEVAKNREMPFIVAADKILVTVLGTHFNVNSYEDGHGVKTTLLEGSVSVSDSQSRRLLVPGQQSGIGPSGEITVSGVDTEEVVAWKDGLFIFNNTGIVPLMQQVSRWYDIEVSFAGAPPADLFSGTIPRTYTLTELLAVLKLAGTDFRLDENRLTILPGSRSKRR